MKRWAEHPRETFDLEDKIISKILENENGCWLWQGAVFNKPYGQYGQIRLLTKAGSKVSRAHRVSYEHFVDKIPKGLELDHLCHETLCVNPDHLEAVTHTENMKRRKDSNLPNCKHGHTYTSETTYINTRGRRECRICRKISRSKVSTA